MPFLDILTIVVSRYSALNLWNITIVNNCLFKMENNFNNDFAKLCYPQVFYIKIYKNIQDCFASPKHLIEPFLSIGVCYRLLKYNSEERYVTLYYKYTLYVYYSI